MSLIIIVGGGAIAAGITEMIQDYCRRRKVYKRRAQMHNMWK